MFHRLAIDHGLVQGMLTAKRRITATRLLVAGAIGALLYFAHVAFVPIALALLLSLVLSGPVEALHRWRIPRSVSAAVLMVTILGSLAGLADVFSEPAQQWFAAAPHTFRLIEKKIRPFAIVMARIGELRNAADNLGAPPNSHPTAAAPPPVTAAPQESAQLMLFDATRGVVLSCVTVVILTLFLLSGGPPMLARMAAAFASDLKHTHIVTCIEKVRAEVGRFYVTTAMINVGLGLATALAMQLCGMPNPLLWGTVAAVLNFIPYAGPTATLLVLSAVAIISFDATGRVIAVAASFLGLATIEGQFIQPLLVGRRLDLNPMLVFLALWFGGLFWGIPGIILATPSLVALKVVAAHSSDGQALLSFLSPHSDLENDDVQAPRVRRRVAHDA
jgi:predicted PurR-regulated permease PerM